MTWNSKAIWNSPQKIAGRADKGTAGPRTNSSGVLGGHDGTWRSTRRRITSSKNLANEHRGRSTVAPSAPLPLRDHAVLVRRVEQAGFSNGTNKMDATRTSSAGSLRRTRSLLNESTIRRGLCAAPPCNQTGMTRLKV